VSKKEEKEEDLLKVLCGNDTELYSLLSRYLYADPSVAVFKRDLGVLIEDAEKSLNEENYREAMAKYQLTVDKAVFDATQNPGEKDRYVGVIQDLVSKTAKVTEKLKEKLEKEGLVDYASSLGGRIKNYRFMSERIEDVVRIASLYYKERLEELGAEERIEAREKGRYGADREEEKEKEAAKARREARKEEIKKMGKGERREAEREDRIQEQREKEKREAKREEREVTEREEDRVEREEGGKREARRKERREARTT
jgi:hypothetical protein